MQKLLFFPVQQDVVILLQRQEERGKRAQDLETAGQGLCLTFKSLTINFL